MKKFAKASRMFRVMLSLIVLVLFSFPVCALAQENILDADAIPEDVTDTTPPESEISDDEYFADDYTLLRSTVSGSSSITKLSSSSVQIAGYSSTPTSDPQLKVTLRLQAYYNGTWNTVATTSKTTSGTYVSKSQSYNVTSGYYYRTYGVHSLQDGSYVTTQTSSVYVG